MQVRKVSPVFRVFGEISVPRAILAVRVPRAIWVHRGRQALRERLVPWVHREMPALKAPEVFRGPLEQPVRPEQWDPRV